MNGMTIDRERWLEKSADSARCLLFSYDVIPVDLNTALARISDLALKPRASFRVLSPQKMRFDEAFTDGGTNTVYLSEATMQGVKDGIPHSRFTLAHELGHLVLKHPGVRSRALNGLDFRVRAGVPGAGRQEAEADFWAGAFLMPRKLVLTCSTPEQLSTASQCSLSAARIRFEGVQRSERRENMQPRSIAPRTQEVLSDLFREWGVEPKSFKLTPLKPKDSNSE